MIYFAAPIPHTRRQHQPRPRGPATRQPASRLRSAILSVIGFVVLYVAIGGFGLVMSAFCFDSGTSAAAWGCFTGINLAILLPSIVCVVASVVLIFLRRYKIAIAVAATPAVLVAILLIVVFVANATYMRAASV